jgi:threonine dehydratase
MTSSAPTAQAVRAAAKRLSGHIRLTPLLESDALNARVGGRVLIKAECLQRTGSFKIRGAYNRLVQITGSGRERGVVAYSSGNHAQGVAFAARALGMPAVIVMPADVPQMKMDRTRALGAEVVTYDRATQSREAIAAEIAWQREATIVPSFDDPDIIAGQGTIGLEIVDQAEAMDAHVDQALVCCGGGGLLSGIGVALKDHWPKIQLYAVEPEAYDDVCRSLEAGKRVANPNFPATVCDALQTQECGEITFAAMKELGVRGLRVSEQEVVNAMAFAFEDLKLVVEPGGAVALAALLAGKVATKDQVTALILSGGNVDRQTFVRCLEAAA